MAANRCAGLKARGLLSAATTAAQAEEALARLTAYGWEPESGALHASLAAFEVAPSIAVTYANALSRASVQDRLCGYSFATTSAIGAVQPTPAAVTNTLFATGNGIPPTAGVQLVNDRSRGVPVRDLFSSNAAGVPTWNLEGALCLRSLVTGTDAAARRLQSGLDETRRTGNLQGKPAIIVHGRDDALIPVNHTSRPYAALNRRVEGAASRLSYIEVTNAQHFDAFIGLPATLPGYDSRYIPPAPVPQPRARCHVRAPGERRAAAGQPSGAHRAARRHAGQRPRDHRGERATHRGHARRCRCRRHHQRRHRRAGLTCRKPPRRARLLGACAADDR